MCISRLHIQSFAFQLFLKLNIMLIDITLAWMNEVIFIKKYSSSVIFKQEHDGSILLAKIFQGI